MDFTSSHIPTEPGDTVPSREARGELVITDNYGYCIQGTRYPYDYLSVFRVLESRAQVRIELYKDAEGVLPCGFEIQVDCTVREKDPNARPKAGNLYDHFIGTLECLTPPPPGCKGKECDPPPPECEDNPSTEEDECCEGEGCNPPPPPDCEDDEVEVNGECVPFCTAHPGDPQCAPSCEDGDAVWNGQAWECPPPEPVCEDLPEFGSIHPAQTNPASECSFFGDFVPTDGTADFYLWKCAQSLEVHEFPPDEEDVLCDSVENDNGQRQEISHVTGCVCAGVN